MSQNGLQSNESTIIVLPSSGGLSVIWNLGGDLVERGLSRAFMVIEFAILQSVGVYVMKMSQ